MPIRLEAIHAHASYTGGVPVMHTPGERYEVTGGGDITADMVANAFEAAGLAKRVDDAVPVKAKKPTTR